MKVFLCIGNEKIEKRIQALNIDIVDSTNDLRTAMRLLDVVHPDVLIINRLLDEDGYDILVLAEEARIKNVKVIILTKSYDDYSEKKMLSALVNKEVNVFLKFDELEEKLIYNIEHYPKQFSYSLFSEEIDGTEDKIIENEKVFSVERRIEVTKTERIREVDKALIIVVSATSSGSTVLAWNLEKAFSDSNYNTALISMDGTAKYLYGIEDNDIDLNKLKPEDNLDDYAIRLGDIRTVYTSNPPIKISKEVLELLIKKCKVTHEIVIIDILPEEKIFYSNLLLSTKIILVFDLAEYNIEKNLKLLKYILTINNKNDIIAVINKYVNSKIAIELKRKLIDMGIDNVFTLSQVPGENIYDLMGTSHLPVDKDKGLKDEMQSILNSLKSREGGKKKNIKNSINKELKIYKNAFKEYIKNKATARVLTIAVVLFIIVLILTVLSSQGINAIYFVDEIKNILGGN